MPRLAPALLRKANAAGPFLSSLLRTCRDLPSASNELRWLREHAIEKRAQHLKRTRKPWSEIDDHTARLYLKKLCLERGRGVPLQHLIGTEYFGDLEIICSPNVLIPRQETAAIVSELARRLRVGIARGYVPQPLRVLDLCTGTGCMSFLLHTELQKLYPRQESPTSTLGVDISPIAIKLAKRNRSKLGLDRKDSQGVWSSPVQFIRANILSPDDSSNVVGAAPSPSLTDWLAQRPEWQECDVVISNPPYISEADFRTTKVERSVRKFEPRLALVPPYDSSSFEDCSLPENQTERDSRYRLLAGADLFYPRIIDIASKLNAKVVLMEVGGSDQADRVSEMVNQQRGWDGADIWRDGMDSAGTSALGEGRAVVCWRNAGADWLNLQGSY